MEEPLDPEKINQLNLDFSALKNEKVLTFKKIQSFLTQKSGKPFNRILLGNIFEQMNCDENSHIAYDDFIKAYSKTEIYLKTAIDEIKQKITDNKQTIIEKQREIIQSRGSQQRPLVAFRIQGARNLKITGLNSRRSIYVKVICQNNSYSTRVSQNPSDPQWNEDFTINISNTSGNILFQVVDSDNLIGESTIDLEDIDDNQQHDEIIEVYNKGYCTGEISINIQLITDKVSYIEHIVDNLQLSIDQEQNELNTFENFFSDIRLPLNSTSSTLANLFDVKAAEANLSRTVDQIGERLFGKEISWDKATNVCVHIYMLLAVLVNFIRPDFFNVKLI